MNVTRKKKIIVSQFLNLIVIRPSKYQANKVANRITIEYQLTEGIRLYKLEINKPKIILGVAEPRIIISGLPV